MQNNELNTDDLLDQLVSEVKARDLAEHNAKIEREQQSKLAAEKRKKEIEKAKLAFEKKKKAELRKKEKKEKEFNLKLKNKGFYLYSINSFMDELGLVATTANRTTNQLFDQSGTLIANADKIVHGKNGFFYTLEVKYSVYTLFHYDKENKKCQKNDCFNSIEKMFEHIEKVDPVNTLGFTNYSIAKQKTPNINDTPVLKIKNERLLEKEKELKKNPFSGDEFDELFK